MDGHPNADEKLTPNPEHLAKLKEGVEAWNAWREENTDVVPELDRAHLAGADLKGADLRVAHLEGAILVEADLEGADLRFAHLEGAHLEGAHLEGADLRWAQLEGANLEGADLGRARLQGAQLVLACLRGARLEGAHLEGANLEGKNLEGAHLGGAHLEGAHLGGASLEGADLEGAHLYGATLEGAHLVWAQLGRADLTGADLEGAHLEGGNLEGTDFTRACLRGACLSDAKTDGTVLSEAEWRKEDGSLPDPALYEGFDVRGVRYSDPLFDQFVRQSEFIRRCRETWPRWLFWLWEQTCNCGRSLPRWLRTCALIILAFGLLFAVTGWAGRPIVKPADESVATVLTPFYFSVVTFSTLGFGDVTPCNIVGQLAVMLEVLLGYAMLGGAISIFTTKFIPSR